MRYPPSTLSFQPVCQILKLLGFLRLVRYILKLLVLYSKTEKLVDLIVRCEHRSYNATHALDIIPVQMFNTPAVPRKFLHLKHLNIHLEVYSGPFSPNYDYFSLLFFLDACHILWTFKLEVSHFILHNIYSLRCIEQLISPSMLFLCRLCRTAWIMIQLKIPCIWGRARTLTWQHQECGDHRLLLCK